MKTCVNLGCGDHIVPSTEKEKWINIDNYVLKDTPDFLQGDVRAIPLEKESVDYLLCDQLLEHLPMHDVPMVLYEIRRVLKIGGRAVILVPDFKSVAEAWLAADHGLGYDPFTHRYLSEPIYGNQAHEGEYHKTAMSPGFLHYALVIAGLPEKEMLLCVTGGPIPTYPGMRAAQPNAYLRNGILIADIVKHGT